LQSAEKAKEVYHTESLKAFQNIYGVGPVKAKELVDQGFRTIADLRKAIHENQLILHEKQLIGLQYYEDLLERIPREEMDQHRQFLHEYLPAELVFDSEIVGSYRRGLSSSGDIDMLLKATTPSITKIFTEFVDDLKEEGYIKHILALGPHKCMAICQLEGKLARRLDLLIVPQEEYAYSMLYFTGSDRFNVAFRQHCLSKGYTLNEHTLTPLHASQPPTPRMETEHDIFRFVGLRYVAPSDRVDGNQIVPLRVRQQVAKLSSAKV
jgi:DNA polymerase beta